mmetsp:Transcript_19668/g.54699  ORF Transcript_19668/g.54699 Transcript_19668/m.54699 type:complete len:225 (-) Transcript_19668:298-972(-)
MRHHELTVGPHLRLAGISHHHAAGHGGGISLGVLGGLKCDVIGLQECIEAHCTLQLWVHSNASQESFESAPSVFHELRREATDGLFIWERWDDGTRSFLMELVGQPDEVAVATKDRAEDLGGCQIGLSLRSHIDTVRCVLVHSLRMLDGVRHRNVSGRIFWFGAKAALWLLLLLLTSHWACRDAAGGSVNHGCTCCHVGDGVVWCAVVWLSCGSVLLCVAAGWC